MDAFPVSRAAEVVETEEDDDDITALQAVGRRGRLQNSGDRRRRLKLTFVEKAALISGLLASRAHSAQGQNLKKKLSEVIAAIKALPTVSAHARVLINVAKVKTFRGSIVASARGLEFTEDESGNFVLDEEEKPTLNEAMRAEKRAYSRAVLTHTDAVALLQGSTSDSVETTRIASAAQRISKIDKSKQN
jgi:hypothetical protein